MLGTWVVACTKPQHEFIAARNVSRQGCEYYLPRFYDRQSRRVRVLFPSYIFVKLLNERFHFLFSTAGVTRLLTSTGGLPSPVPLAVIDSIQMMEREGLVHLPDRDEFTVGQSVVVTHGPFKSQIGIYQGMNGRDRVTVLLSLFGHRSKINCSRSWIAAT